jgi:uncharacterized tellurite resistance protein B-like protein
MENSQAVEKTNKMIQVLDWAYDKSLKGLPGAGSAIELAEDYLKKNGTLTENVNTLIRWQISKTSTTGFLAGLGGLMTMPITIPVDVASALYVQIRMIAAIAHMGGFDVKDDKVKSLVYVCLVGESAKDILKDVGIQLGLKVGQNLLKSLPGKILTKINQAVGFRLVTKFGTKGLVNLVKVVPILGGVVGGSINGIATNTIGNIARNTFIKNGNNEPIAEQFIDLLDDKIDKTQSNDLPNYELLKLNSYLNIIKIDGKITNEEYEFFDNIITNSLLDDNIKMNLIQKLNSKEMENVDYTIFKNNPNESLNLLQNLIFISKCDKEFHITEKMYIKNIGRQLNFSDSDIESLFNS